MSEEIIPATTVVAKSIKAINRESVHRICSGQVILSLSIAVKELLENAVDAGATVVDIRLREYGSDLIEVIDNGSGVNEPNIGGLTLKHHTSKIEQFTDVLEVETFGFRGEALSSLCALADMSITTRHYTMEHGFKMEYDHNGQIIKRAPIARSVGTTVSLSNLFAPLPVRRKEFLKNLKREFTKMCNLLYAYVLISHNIRITCSNITKGSRTTVVTTQATNSLRDNIICVFGHKQLKNVVEFQQSFPDATILEDFKIIHLKEDENPFNITGYLSDCAHGSGRSSQDRQFYYVNKRPCELTKCTKIINEIYHQFNSNQYPFVLLNVDVKRTMVDVNVTPDKRKLFLQNENLLLAIIKYSLLKLFEHVPSTFTINNTFLPKVKKEPQDKDESNTRGVKREAESLSYKPSLIRTLFDKRIKISDDFKQDLSESSDDEVSHTSVRTACKYKNESPKEKVIFIDTKFEAKNIHSDEKNSYEICEIQKPCFVENRIRETTNDNITTNGGGVTKTEIKLEQNESFSKFENNDRNLDVNASDYIEKESEPHSDTSSKIQENIPSSSKREVGKKNNTTKKTPPKKAHKENKNIESDRSNSDVDYDEEEIENPLQITTDDNFTVDKTAMLERQFITVNVTLDSIKEKLLARKKQQTDISKSSVNFKSAMTPLSSSHAETELKKEIKKSTFNRMDIIGQFNLGFIVTKFESHLFIIDQHASDEKYNFEMLQKNTVMDSQPLVIPQKLDLTVANKTVLLDNMNIFNANGFYFDVKEENDHQSISMTKIPMNKNVCLGTDDVEELIFMLQDGSHTMCRPSRIRAMFASRACRKSVMIGIALGTSDMRRIVDHMADMDQPWNCPHGRPTMRHLANLSLITGNYGMTD